MRTVKSRRRHQKRSRWARANTPEALRRRRAKQDAEREALAATLPPAYVPPQPLTLWQSITIDLYVPTVSARCDQHATVIDGERVGLLSATQIGAKLRELIRKRPSLEVVADVRREEWQEALRSLHQGGHDGVRLRLVVWPQ